MTITQRTQNSPLTNWIWRYWRHQETGEIIILPVWRKPECGFERWGK